MHFPKLTLTIGCTLPSFLKLDFSIILFYIFLSYDKQGSLRRQTIMASTLVTASLAVEHQALRKNVSATSRVVADAYKETPFKEIRNLYQLLQASAATSSGITTHSSGDPFTGRYTSYKQLLQIAETKARLICGIPGITPDSVILLHFDEHLDNIEWFWAVTASGHLPAISTPFTNDLNQRRKHINNLYNVLQNPIVLTLERLVPEFLAIERLNIHPVDILASSDMNSLALQKSKRKSADDKAALMLTSGSTGLSKAVCIRHQQILDCVKGKSRLHGLTNDEVFLNWIGFDHVANLVETHIHAMSLGVDQVHVHSSDVVKDPSNFLRLLEEYRITYTFAPNFFLALLSKDLLRLESSSKTDKVYDLSHLRAVISGGEANVVETCAKLTEQLKRHGVTSEVIRPGLGMTETCAGSIYSTTCPSYDLEQKNKFATVGSCIEGIRIRIITESGVEAAVFEVGSLQITGNVVFREYYNNPSATEASFTKDGWFITGDRAFLDANGYLNLVGRTNDIIIVNGVHHSLSDIETSLEKTPGVFHSYTTAFPHWPSGSQTEQLCIVYAPTYDAHDNEARSKTSDAITKASAVLTGAKPFRIIPLPHRMIEKSSLGKISRSKIRENYENGTYDQLAADNDEAIRTHRAMNRKKPANDLEQSVLALLSIELGISDYQVGVEASIFDLGMNSLNVLAFKKKLQDISPSTSGLSIPLTAILLDPTARGVANALVALAKPSPYNPIVPLQTYGNKTPLWLFHPGSGDILAFVALSQKLLDRPVYGIRARGFNVNDTFFTSIGEMAVTYFTHILKKQPQGPYAMAGYSLGSSVAFEVARLLEDAGQDVKFLGLIDSPPHIRCLIKDLGYNDVMLNVAYFMGMIPEHEIITTDLDRFVLLDEIFKQTPPVRLEELDMSKQKLLQVCDMTSAFGDAAKKYEPSGTVACADIFWATPLMSVTNEREDWTNGHLAAWKDFVRRDLKWYECEGRHANMLNTEFVGGFAKRLQNALESRGV